MNGGMLNDGAAKGRTVHGGTTLRAGALALLLEPLRVDAVVGPAALQPGPGRWPSCSNR
ncbi:hypothetical protein [Streptomyces sp. NPDC006999]|uniref:hypothetical protein n=1 Tax=Streptomyces sp. NPDC006999 TaxID=3156909 RepID=UPI0033C85A8E